MAARDFPSIAPTSRSFDPGTYPQTLFEAQNGATTVVRYSNKRVNAKLSMTFSNITDDEAESIVNNYIAVNSEWNHVRFQANNPALSGLDGSLKIFLANEPEGLRWRYMEAPKVQSVQPGISTVQCKFCAYLDG